MNNVEVPVEPVLHVSGVRKSFNGRAALNDFSITMHPGSVHGLLGSNGSGKSTALHIITGITEADAGTVHHNGISVEHPDARSRFGLAPDDLPLPQSVTGREYLRLHDSLRGRDDTEWAADFARVLRIRHALGKPMSSYSHGMKRKVQLICALMHRPSLLILDEPFRGLDPDTAGTLQKCLELHAASGGSVLIATHDLLRAEAHCEHITMLHDGDTVKSGTTAQIVAEYGTLQQCFSMKTATASTLRARDSRLSALFTAS